MDRLRRVWNETHRPPPLRTTSTYDDDEAFNNTAKQLFGVSRSPKEAIFAVLVTPQQRSSFLEGLCHRKERTPNSLILSIDERFGSILKDIISSETANPKTPRCDEHEKKPRRFFPDVDFRKTRRVQNIDWKLCAAVTAVGNLRLDGHQPTTCITNNSYEPPHHL